MLRGYLGFDGIDGSGKTSVLGLVQERLEGAGVLCFPLKMNSWLDPQATRVIVDSRHGRARHRPESIRAAYARDLALQAEAVIAPATLHGVVLQDRTPISAAVYQEVLFAIPARASLDAYRAAGLPFPSLIVFADVEAGEAGRRIAARGNQRRAWENDADLARLRAGFTSVLVEDPPSWLPPVVRLQTDLGWREKVVDELLPRIRRQLLADAVTHRRCAPMR